MAYTKYTGAEAVSVSGRRVGAAEYGTAEYITTKNAASMEGGGSTDTFTSSAYDLGLVKISGKQVVVGIIIDDISALLTSQGASTSWVFDGDAKADGGSITLTDANGTSKTYYGRTGHDVSATCVNGLSLAGVNGSSVNEGCNFTNLTVAAGCQDGTTTILLDEDSTTGSADAAANQISIGVSGVASDEALTDLMVKAINGTADSRITYATSEDGTGGVFGITAAEGSSATQITLTMDQGGAEGNIAGVLTEIVGGADMVAVADFTGGVDDRVLRSDEFFVVTSAQTTAANLLALVIGANGHNGTIGGLVTPNSATLTATMGFAQQTFGMKGNTIVTTDAIFDSYCTGTPPNFTLGADYDIAAEFSADGVNFTAFDPALGTGTTGINIANDLTLGPAPVNKATFILDARNINFPFMRLIINSQGRTMPATMDFTLSVTYPSAYKPSTDLETWNAKGERY